MSSQNDTNDLNLAKAEGFYFVAIKFYHLYVNKLFKYLLFSHLSMKFIDS